MTPSWVSGGCRQLAAFLGRHRSGLSCVLFKLLWVVEVMMRRFALGPRWYWLMMAIWSACAACASADYASANPAMSDIQMQQSFAQLRLIRGHFEGGPWNDAVDKWQGVKHVAMQQLAQSVLRAKAASEKTKELLGPPDKVLTKAQFAQLSEYAPVSWQGVAGSVVWLYRWRGEHDQLAVSLDQGRVVAVGWLYALER
jgi:hypothetical protein